MNELVESKIHEASRTLAEAGYETFKLKDGELEKRKNDPVVNDAYEQYKTVLKLSKGQ